MIFLDKECPKLFYVSLLPAVVFILLATIWHQLPSVAFPFSGSVIGGTEGKSWCWANS